MRVSSAARETTPPAPASKKIATTVGIGRILPPLLEVMP
jgi:hypothetical protein